MTPPSAHWISLCWPSTTSHLLHVVERLSRDTSIALSSYLISATIYLLSPLGSWHTATIPAIAMLTRMLAQTAPSSKLQLIKGALTGDVFARQRPRAQQLKTLHSATPCQLSPAGMFVLHYRHLLGRVDDPRATHYQSQYRQLLAQLLNAPGSAEQQSLNFQWSALLAVVALMSQPKISHAHDVEDWLTSFYCPRTLAIGKGIAMGLQLAMSGATQGHVLSLLYAALPPCLLEQSVQKYHFFVGHDGFPSPERNLVDQEVAKMLIILRHGHSFTDILWRNLKVPGQRHARSLVLGAISGALFGTNVTLWRLLAKRPTRQALNSVRCQHLVQTPSRVKREPRRAQCEGARQYSLP